MSIAQRLQQTRRLKGFTETLFPGSRDSCDSSFNCGVPLPPWAGVLGLIEITVEVDASRRDHMDEGPGMDNPDDNDGIVPRELDIDTDLVIQLMERINTTASLDDDVM
jgi:hypothetical protein